MSETPDVNTFSRRQALSRFGWAAALAPAVALGISSAHAQTPGMERRQERRDDRQERREDRRDNRQERRDDRRGLSDEDQAERKPETKGEAAPK